MITLETLRETKRKAKGNDKWAPISYEINETVAGMLKQEPTISDKELHEALEMQMEFIAVSLPLVEELAGFFRSNPEALDAYLAELEAERLEEAAKPKVKTNREGALAFLNQ